MSSYQSVDVYVLDQATHQPVPGVIVRVFSPDGVSAYTQDTTDDQGHVGFLLYTQSYSLRFYKYQVTLRQPLYVDVVEGPGGTPTLNAFNVYAELLTPPLSNDARLCRASGVFRDVFGAPQKNLNIIFIAEFAPIIVDGAGVVSERRAVKTDQRGYACVDLFRCANYAATVQGYEDHVRRVRVPDAPSVNLPDLLFPTVASVSFEPPSPWTLSAGSDLTVTPTTLTTSGIPTLGPDLPNVNWKTSDPTVCSVMPVGKTLALHGLKPGTTTLQVYRKDQSIILVPTQGYDPATKQVLITEQPLTVL